MQYGLHRNILKISTKAANNKKEKPFLQYIDQSGIKYFFYVEQDEDLDFFSASSLLPFCANAIKEQQVAERECGWKTSTKADKSRL